MKQLVLLRHGQSTWNLENRFTGWKDVDLTEEQKPRAECLKDTVDRFLPYWNEAIVPDLQKNRRVLIVAHGNSLRALVKHLDGMSDEEIVGLNIPTGVPLVYELEDDLTPKQHFYLGDPEKIAAAAKAVAEQGKAKS